MIKVIVIDDEPLALQQIAEMVKRTPYFELVAACDSAFEAMQTMEQQHIDAIFTDINMPDLSGMKYIESLREQPIVVFTTAYSQYAVDGYKVGAVDYLLKPFGQPEFQRAAAKVKEQYELRQAAHLQAAATPTTPASSDNNILFVKDGYNYIRILLADIVCARSWGDGRSFRLIYQTPAADKDIRCRSECDEYKKSAEQNKGTPVTVPL